MAERPQLISVFGASPAVAAGAVIYLRISLFGAPFMLITLAGTGVLRGLQDTRTPLVVSVAANAVNIVLNAVLVLGLRLGLAGSAPGTVIAQTAAAAVYLVMITRGARRAGWAFARMVPGCARRPPRPGACSSARSLCRLSWW